MNQSLSTLTNPKKSPSVMVGYVVSCALVALATFVAFGLLWPLTGSETRAITIVSYSLPSQLPDQTPLSSGRIKSALSMLVAQTLSGDSFRALVDQTSATGPVVSNEIEYHDLDNIRAAIDLEFSFSDNFGRLKIGYRCDGQPDQVRFLRILGHRVSTLIDQVFVDDAGKLNVANAATAEKFERAVWLAKQLQSDIAEANADAADTANTDSTGQASPFRLASTRKIDPEIVREIYTDNVQTLSGLLDDLNMNARGSTLEATTFDVVDVSPIKTNTIGATPSRFATMWLLSLSALAAGFVAVFYDGGHLQGFASVDAMTEILGIPVVAIVPTAATDKSGSTLEAIFVKVAPLLVNAAKVFLLAVFIVAISFSLVDSSIREALFQNPFEAFAKIFNVF